MHHIADLSPASIKLDSFRIFPLFSHLFAGDGSFRSLYLPGYGVFIPDRAGQPLEDALLWFVVVCGISMGQFTAPARNNQIEHALCKKEQDRLFLQLFVT